MLDDAEYATLAGLFVLAFLNSGSENNEGLRIKRRRASMTAEGSSVVMHSGGRGKLDVPASLDMVRDCFNQGKGGA